MSSLVEVQIHHNKNTASYHRWYSRLQSSLLHWFGGKLVSLLIDLNMLAYNVLAADWAKLPDAQELVALLGIDWVGESCGRGSWFSVSHHGRRWAIVHGSLGDH